MTPRRSRRADVLAAALARCERAGDAHGAAVAARAAGADLGTVLLRAQDWRAAAGVRGAQAAREAYWAAREAERAAEAVRGPLGALIGVLAGLLDPERFGEPAASPGWRPAGCFPVPGSGSGKEAGSR